MNILILILIPFIVVILIILLKWKEILSFFRPSLFYLIYISTKKGTIIDKLIFKPFFKGDKFKYNDGEYFLDPQIFKLKDSIQTWEFDEGNPQPRTSFSKTSTISSELINETMDLKFISLFSSGSLNDLLPYILITGLGLLLIALLYIANQQSQATQQTNDLLLNLTNAR